MEALWRRWHLMEVLKDGQELEEGRDTLGQGNVSPTLPASRLRASLGHCLCWGLCHGG